MAPSVVQFFVTRGYTLVAPLRRGVSESSGTYREECAQWAGKCSHAEYVALFDAGLREAVLDTSAEATTRRFHRAFTDAGGRGEYFFVASHELKSGHQVATDPSLWGPAADDFLKKLQ